MNAWNYKSNSMVVMPEPVEAQAVVTETVESEPVNQKLIETAQPQPQTPSEIEPQTGAANETTADTNSKATAAAAAGDPLSNIPHLNRSEYRALINETLAACDAIWHPVCGDPDPDGIHQTAIGAELHQIRHDPSIIDAEARRLCRLECDKFKKMYLESSETYLRAARAQIGGLSDSLKTRMIEIREEHIQRGESDTLARILTVQHAVEMKWISAEPGSPIGGGNGDGGGGVHHLDSG